MRTSQEQGRIARVGWIGLMLALALVTGQSWWQARSLVQLTPVAQANEAKSYYVYSGYTYANVCVNGTARVTEYDRYNRIRVHCTSGTSGNIWRSGSTWYFYSADDLLLMKALGYGGCLHYSGDGGRTLYAWHGAC